MSIPIKDDSRLGRRAQPQLQKASESLEAMALEMEAGTCLPPVLELRRSLGVSLTTLNSALGVLEARGVVERRNGVGVFVLPRSRAVALLCDPSFFEGSSHSPLWSLMAKGLRERAEQKNEGLEFHFSRVAGLKNSPLPVALTRAIEEKRVQGVLGLGLHVQAMRWLQESGVPTVGFACWGDEKSHLVSYDHERDFLEQGASILAERGCSRVELWRPVTQWLWPQYPDHLEVLRHHVARLGEHWQEVAGGLFESAAMRFCPELLKENAPTRSHQEQGRMLVQQVFGRPRKHWPQGVLVWDDMMAHGALMALGPLGVEVGRGLQFVSQSNAGSPVLEREREAMTLLEFDPDEGVQLMFDQLERLMNGQRMAPGLTPLKARRRDIGSG